MRARRPLMAMVGAAALLFVACGDDQDDAADTTAADSTTSVVATTSGGASTTSADTSTTGEATTTTGEATTTTGTTATSGAAGLEQPAIWPAADVVFETPEEAAEDFVTQVLGVPPVLGEFRQGDTRSGEIEVLSAGEGDSSTGVVRSVLLLRQLGADSGWFVLAAVNENAAVTTPEAMAEVPAGPLTVEGMARGFEGNVVVSAFVAGDATAQLDEEITMGGAMETPEPISVTLDMSAASPGDVVTLLVRGGTGLETDPGDFGAVPVVIG
jgi:Immunoglobulin-like domain of bacterial spore germination